MIGPMVDEDVRRLLALEEARERRRVRRNRALGWLAVLLVVGGVVTGFVVKQQQEERVQEERVQRMFDDMIGR